MDIYGGEIPMEVIQLMVFSGSSSISIQKNLVIAQSAAWPLAGSRELSKNRNEFVNAVLKALDN